MRGTRAAPRGFGSKCDQIQVYFTDNTYRFVPCGLETTVREVMQEIRGELHRAERLKSKMTSCMDADGLFIITPGHCALRERTKIRRLDATDKPFSIYQSCGSAFKFLYKVLHNEEPVQVDPVKGIRSGILEKHSRDGKKWKPRKFVLGADRIWYWKNVASSEVFARSHLPMLDVEKVMEHPMQNSVFTIVTRRRIYVLKARSFQDRDGWVLALTKQIALFNESAWIERADNTLSAIERQRSSILDGAIDRVSTYIGALRFCEGSRDLFKTFALDTCQNKAQRQDLALFLDQIADGANPAAMCAEHHASCESYIFPLFQNDHIFQRTLEHLLIKE